MKEDILDNLSFIPQDEEIKWAGRPNLDSWFTFSSIAQQIAQTFLLSLLSFVNILYGLKIEQRLFAVGILVAAATLRDFYGFFWSKPRHLRNTIYCITDKKIYIMGCISEKLEEIKEPILSMNKNDIGDVDFRIYFPGFIFRSIENARKVYEMIQDHLTKVNTKDRIQ